MRLAALLDRVRPTARATHLTLHASKDDFHASIPLDEVRERGLVVFRLEGAPLADEAGGPFRFLIVDAASCRAAEVDTCANVKFVDRLELTAGRGDDNRPTTPRDHRKLHASTAEEGRSDRPMNTAPRDG
ncbi:MAG: molybdopterin-dependent oxidoreductase [Planctomycetota bacterium JB042]